MLSMRYSGLVARGLKMNRSTNLVVASVTAGVASNATVAMQFTAALGQMVLSSIIFATVAIGIWAISVDIFSRSGQTISNMRSIGATAAGISSAILVPVMLYSAAGSAIGALLGIGIGVLVGASPGLGLALEFIGVVLACSMASAVGVYAGVRTSWRS